MHFEVTLIHNSIAKPKFQKQLKNIKCNRPIEQKPHMLWPIEEPNQIFKRLNENIGEEFISKYLYIIPLSKIQKQIDRRTNTSHYSLFYERSLKNFKQLTENCRRRWI